MKELEAFYEQCRKAPVPHLQIRKREPIHRLLLTPALGLATGVLIFAAILLATPRPDFQRGRDAADAVIQIQLAETTPPVQSRPRVARQGHWNA